MNNKVTIKHIFLFYIMLATPQLPAADLSALTFLLNLTNFAQQYSKYLPEIRKHLPEMKKYIPFQKINGHKKSLIAATVILVFASMLYISLKNKNLQRRRDLENDLELDETLLKKISAIISNFFSTTMSKVLWKIFGLRNRNLNTLFQEGKKPSEEQIKKMKEVLEGNNFDDLPILVQTPSWIDQFFISYYGKLIDPNIKLTNNGQTPLHFTIQSNLVSGKLDRINILLANGARATQKDNMGNDALHYAIKAVDPDIEIIECLYGVVGISNNSNSNLESYLHLISNIQNKEKREEVAKILIGSNQNWIKKFLFKKPLNMRAVNKNRDTPLLYAARNNRPELVELFLTEANADIEQVDKFGYSVLAFAIVKKWIKLDYLFNYPNINKIIDLPNKNGVRPIHLAIIHKNDYCIEQFIKQHVNITDETQFAFKKKQMNCSPLQLACSTKYKDAVTIFLENDAIPTNFTTANGNTLAHLIVNNFEEHQAIELMKEIQDKGFSLHETDANDKTPLEIAFEQNYFDLVKFFLEQGNIPRDFAFSDDTSLINKIAKLKTPKAEELMKLLLTKLVNEEELKSAYDDNAFKLALQSNSPAANCFIQGDDTPRNVVFDYNTTPAHIVAQLKTGDELMESLAEHDFPLDNPNENGQRPVEIACNNNNISVLQVLIKQHAARVARDTVYSNNQTLASLIVAQFTDEESAQLISLAQKNGFSLQYTLHEAIKQKKQKTIDLLISNPHLRKETDQNGRLPSHYAAEQGNRPLCEKLNQTKKEQSQADMFGQTPYQLLKKNEPFLSKIKYNTTEFLRERLFALEDAYLSAHF